MRRYATLDNCNLLLTSEDAGEVTDYTHTVHVISGTVGARTTETDTLSGVHHAACVSNGDVVHTPATHFHQFITRDTDSVTRTVNYLLGRSFYRNAYTAHRSFFRLELDVFLLRYVLNDLDVNRVRIHLVEGGDQFIDTRVECLEIVPSSITTCNFSSFHTVFHQLEGCAHNGLAGAGIRYRSAQFSVAGLCTQIER